MYYNNFFQSPNYFQCIDNAIHSTNSIEDHKLAKFLQTSARYYCIGAAHNPLTNKPFPRYVIQKSNYQPLSLKDSAGDLSNNPYWTLFFENLSQSPAINLALAFLSDFKENNLTVPVISGAFLNHLYLYGHIKNLLQPLHYIAQLKPIADVVAWINEKTPLQQYRCCTFTIPDKIKSISLYVTSLIISSVATAAVGVIYRFSKDVVTDIFQYIKSKSEDIIDEVTFWNKPENIKKYHGWIVEGQVEFDIEYEVIDANKLTSNEVAIKHLKDPNFKLLAYSFDSKRFMLGTDAISTFLKKLCVIDTEAFDLRMLKKSDIPENFKDVILDLAKNMDLVEVNKGVEAIQLSSQDPNLDLTFSELTNILRNFAAEFITTNGMRTSLLAAINELFETIEMKKNELVNKADQVKSNKYEAVLTCHSLLKKYAGTINFDTYSPLLTLDHDDFKAIKRIFANEGIISNEAMLDLEISKFISNRSLNEVKTLSSTLQSWCSSVAESEKEMEKSKNSIRDTAKDCHSLLKKYAGTINFDTYSPLLKLDDNDFKVIKKIISNEGIISNEAMLDLEISKFISNRSLNEVKTLSYTLQSWCSSVAESEKSLLDFTLALAPLVKESGAVMKYLSEKYKCQTTISQIVEATKLKDADVNFFELLYKDAQGFTASEIQNKLRTFIANKNFEPLKIIEEIIKRIDEASKAAYNFSLIYIDVIEFIRKPLISKLVRAQLNDKEELDKLIYTVKNGNICMIAEFFAQYKSDDIAKQEITLEKQLMNGAIQAGIEAAKNLFEQIIYESDEGPDISLHEKFKELVGDFDKLFTNLPINHFKAQHLKIKVLDSIVASRKNDSTNVQVSSQVLESVKYSLNALIANSNNGGDSSDFFAFAEFLLMSLINVKDFENAMKLVEYTDQLTSANAALSDKEFFLKNMLKINLYYSIGMHSEVKNLISNTMLPENYSSTQVAKFLELSYYLGVTNSDSGTEDEVATAVVMASNAFKAASIYLSFGQSYTLNALKISEFAVYVYGQINQLYNSNANDFTESFKVHTNAKGRHGYNILKHSLDVLNDTHLPDKIFALLANSYPEDSKQSVLKGIFSGENLLATVRALSKLIDQSSIFETSIEAIAVKILTDNYSPESYPAMNCDLRAATDFYISKYLITESSDHVSQVVGYHILSSTPSFNDCPRLKFIYPQAETVKHELECVIYPKLASYYKELEVEDPNAIYFHNGASLLAEQCNTQNYEVTVS